MIIDSNNLLHAPWRDAKDYLDSGPDWSVFYKILDLTPSGIDDEFPWCLIVLAIIITAIIIIVIIYKKKEESEQEN